MISKILLLAWWKLTWEIIFYKNQPIVCDEFGDDVVRQSVTSEEIWYQFQWMRPRMSM